MWMKRRVLIRWRDQWEVTANDIISFSLDCLKILAMVFEFFRNIAWAVLKVILELAVVAAALYGLWRLVGWLFFILFGH